MATSLHYAMGKDSPFKPLFGDPEPPPAWVWALVIGILFGLILYIAKGA